MSNKKYLIRYGQSSRFSLKKSKMVPKLSLNDDGCDIYRNIVITGNSKTILQTDTGELI